MLGRARRRDPVLWSTIAVTVLFSASVASAVTGVGQPAKLAAPRPVPVVVTSTTTTVTVTTTTTSTTLPPTTTTAKPAPPPTAPRPRVVPKKVVPTPPLPPGSIDAFRGLGSWVDVFDWSMKYTNNNPPFGLPDVDRMAAVGNQTMFIQAARADTPEQAVLEPDRVRALIDRAHARGLRVVVWYLPSLEDTTADLGHLLAIAKLPNEGISVDIESTKVADPQERGRRLVSLSAALRQALPDRVLAACVLPPVVTDVINTHYWPEFPWTAISNIYNVWQVMDYWTNRTQSSGYRDAYRYTAENLDRLKAHLGGAAILMDPVGGIGDKTTPDDVNGFHRAASERGAIGGGMYDYRTTGDALWAPLQAFRS